MLVIASVAVLTPAIASAETLGLGGSLRGLGGVASVDSGLSAGVGMDAPDMLANAGPRIKGVNAGGGFGAELFVSIHDLRIGLDTAVLFTDAFRLSNAPLPNGFTASTRSATSFAFALFFGRAFEAGPLRPYVDLRFGLALVQTSIRLEHPTFGFVGATQYDGYRFLFGPRAGMYVPLGNRFYIDLGGDFDILGFNRVAGFAGIAWLVGSDDRDRDRDRWQR